MTDLTTYLVLGMVIVPPILRQAGRLVSTVRAPRQGDPSQPPPPKLLSQTRLTPFATPFSTTVSIATLLLVLISLRNLIPVQYGFDLFIPAAAIEGLRKSIYTLYTAPSVDRSTDGVENAPIHIEAFRGGYKPDLFLAYKAPITIPTTTLRNLINDAPSLLPIGLLTHANQAQLQALIARLSSYEGRRMYLLLGPAPLLDCTFCNTAGDYFWYAVPFLLGTYAWRILALGLLTTHPHDSVAVAIRQAGSLFGLSSSFSQSPPAQGLPASKPYEADRSGWRAPSLTVLLGLLVVELLVMFEFGQVTADFSRLNHWHTNLHILRQIVYLSLVLITYVSPAPQVLGGFEQSMLHLEATQQSLQSLLHVSELTDVTRTVVLQDDELLQTSRESRSSHSSTRPEIGPEEAERIIQAARVQGGEAASQAIAQAQEGIRRVTRSWWHNVEQVNQQVDQRVSVVRSPSVPLQPEQSQQTT
ncbi:uncharacterized protein UTRI_04651_B [Ustilago trichophora]|uniref:Uncharacterized protein n=1 Tax=Ustilago trichophora TaxID=86804 RepID=A0A5C3EC58_9BASI|nr:uncharacterized protein UTRI_04651_B [Ustilago trichophora]